MHIRSCVATSYEDYVTPLCVDYIRHKALGWLGSLPECWWYIHGLWDLEVLTPGVTQHSFWMLMALGLWMWCVEITYGICYIYASRSCQAPYYMFTCSCVLHVINSFRKHTPMSQRKIFSTVRTRRNIPFRVDLQRYHGIWMEIYQLSMLGTCCRH